MRARLISTDGEYLEARIDIDGTVLHVMDEFSPAECGDVLDIELIPMLDEHESNNDILDGNPDRKRGLERIESWSYRAFGIICSLSPVIVDCGLVQLEDDIEETGIGIGQPVAFTISRLSARHCEQAASAARAASLPTGIDDATAAAYHDLGFKLRIFDEDFVKDWAYRIISERDTPTIPIIEIATAPDRDTLFSALRMASERGNILLATRLMLGHLHQELSTGRISTRSAVRTALKLCDYDTLDASPAHSDFLNLNEDIYLSEFSVKQSDEDLRRQALSFLSEHAQIAATSTDSGAIEKRSSMYPVRLPGGSSVRAASWIAAQCVRAHAARRHLMTPELEAFCEYLEALISADDVVAWDNEGSMLAITGLGDALPARLDRDPELASLVAHAREITATQIYGAWEPNVVAHHLESCLDIAGQDLLHTIPVEVLAHRPLHHGWGNPLPRQPRPEGGPE